MLTVILSVKSEYLVLSFEYENLVHVGLCECKLMTINMLGAQQQYITKFRFFSCYLRSHVAVIPYLSRVSALHFINEISED